MLYAGYRIDRFLVGMSYDISAGKINEAGKGYNAFELSIMISSEDDSTFSVTAFKAVSDDFSGSG